MIRVGLTGGIGAGKSTVAEGFVERGAVVVDGDRIARELVEPGEPALEAIVERFGAAMLRADGTLDRAGLAGVVFPDPEQLAALDAIMGPRIAARAAQMAADAEASGVDVVVYDMPLLVENGTADDFDLVVVVTAPAPTRLARLALRGVDLADAQARMARQATDEQRAAVAHILIDNSGDDEQLEAQVDRAWHLIRAGAGLVP